MNKLDHLLREYGESHRDSRNKTIHWICVPVIFFTLLSLLRCVPVFDFMGAISPHFNWVSIALFLSLLYYISLSLKLSIGFLLWSLFVYFANNFLWEVLGTEGLLIWAITVFVLAWIGQFIGHKIEGKKPSFLKDIQFLLVGPAWLMVHLFDKKRISA